MPKILRATCDQSGMVLVDGVHVPAARVLSEGKQESEGLLLLDEDRADYFPSSATDVKSTIEKLIALVESIASNFTTIANELTAIGGGMTGSTTAPPGSLPSSVSSINSKVAELNAKKSELQNLMGALK